jgi:hypothetical protein
VLAVISSALDAAMMRVESALRTPLRVAGCTALVFAALFAARWGYGGRDFTRFVVLGEKMCRPDKLPFRMQVLPDYGYDGHYFLRVALDPWTSGQYDNGIKFDNGAYRHQRILYPLLAWLLALGKAAWVPFTMVLVNFLALVGLGFAAARLAEETGNPPWLGILPPVFGGFMMAAGRDLAEPLAGLLVVVALLAMLRRNWPLYALAITGAILSREDALIAAAVAGVTAVALDLRARRWPAGKWFWLALPGLVFVAWQWVLWRHWGKVPVLDAPPNRGAFGLGFLEAIFVQPIREGFAEGSVRLLSLGWNVWLGILAARTFFLPPPARREESHTRYVLYWLRGAWVAEIVLCLTLTNWVWGDDWAMMRVLARWSVLGLTMLFLYRRRPDRGFLCLTFLVFAGTFLRLIVRP